jgi:plastocyanin
MKSGVMRYFLTAFLVALIAIGCAPKEEAPTEGATAEPATVSGAPEMSAAPATTEPAAASTPAPTSEAPVMTTSDAPATATAENPTTTRIALDAVKDAATTAVEEVKEAAETVVATATGGASTGIVGKVVFEGPAPKRPTLETEGDPKCHAMHADKPLLSEREVVGADGSVQWAFAYIKNPPAGTHPTPATAAHMDQIGCAYTPHVLGVQVGQKVEIKNSDPTLHNVRGIARVNKPFNFGQPEGSPPRERVFDKPEMEIRLKCDIHSWMTSYIFAMEHPFFAISDANGAFNITGLPAGDYTLVVWHESFGTQEVSVNVTADAPSPVTVTLKPKA